MTVAHFEIIKSKLDSLQFELIDLLRHVKDYTQRYMNAIRQQDLDKINEYITGLFEVDKTLKETQALAAEGTNTEDEEEAEPQDRQGVITKATSGIKNFFGSIGNNVSSITNLVTNTTKIANDMLTKKIMPTSNSNATISNTSNTSNTNNASKLVTNKNITTNSVSKNSNVVSIDEYISDIIMDLEEYLPFIEKGLTDAKNSITTGIPPTLKTGFVGGYYKKYMKYKSKYQKLKKIINEKRNKSKNQKKE